MSKFNVSEVFKALSDEHRITILKVLKTNEMCAGEILEQLDISQPTLSHHMKTLVESGLVTTRKQAKFTYYSISPVLAENILETVSEIFGVEKPSIVTTAEKVTATPKKDLPSHLL